MKKHIYTTLLGMITLSIFGQVTDTGDKVGIGINSPAYKLHVSSPENQLMRFTSTDGTWLDFESTNAGAGNRIWSIGHLGISNKFGIYQRDGTEEYRLLIDQNGNVGIGTTSPNSKLHVKGSDLWLKLEDSNANSYASTNAGIQFNNSYATVGQIFQTGEDLVMESLGGTSNLLFKTKTIERLRIDKDGNVGIGTTTTGSHKLAVHGSIGARKVKVEASGWSDFVFENDYQLRPLGEVEKYISENKHLPEIPSAKEVKKDGIDLGEMDSKLLQKIEELTLYLIEQNKQNKLQQSEIEKLKKELKAIKKNNSK